VDLYGIVISNSRVYRSWRRSIRLWKYSRRFMGKRSDYVAW